MREHLSTVHPQKQAFIGVRKMKVELVDLVNQSNNVVTYTHIIDLVDKKKDNEIKVKLWKDPKDALNSPEAEDVKPQLRIQSAFSLSNADEKAKENIL